MNQDILFADLQSWDSERQAVCFPAQQAGALIRCWVRLDWLEKKAEMALTDEAAILAAFAEYRFDLEELAESSIDEENFNQDGEIMIG
ncbi:DUF1488 domain-containing protein [Photobacterium sp. WH77]|uniref:DUF1488 family protein n=1 Tax=Photobacterium halotolerans TaxID=265726 RepID=A0A7X4WCW8_9GAMM|nr:MULTISPECIES: DUF1488 domain-containing protein [Photobacterium]MCG2839250.1 DUF1488 domain-containing protein [Photobacterium sp. WH77]MCG2846847.1 DUF1488 domain-containing protein [Photobacterium sp. WH80]NAW66456.1 DUF1488 family protein [Photobacterium halotolerans]